MTKIEMLRASAKALAEQNATVAKLRLEAETLALLPSPALHQTPPVKLEPKPAALPAPLHFNPAKPNSPLRRWGPLVLALTLGFGLGRASVSSPQPPVDSAKVTTPSAASTPKPAKPTPQKSKTKLKSSEPSEAAEAVGNAEAPTPAWVVTVIRQP